MKRVKTEAVPAQMKLSFASKIRTLLFGVKAGCIVTLS